MSGSRAVALEIDSDLADYAADHDLDLATLLEQAIASEKQHHRRKTPRPTIPDAVYTLLEQMHETVVREATTGTSGFQERLPDARIAINALRTDDGYRITVYLEDVETLPNTTINSTLAESGDFLTEISADLRGYIADLNGTTADAYTFELLQHENEHPEFDDYVPETASYRLYVAVDSDAPVSLTG